MKISILSPDLSNNCFGRAWLLAKLLQRNYDVEVIGPIFGEEIWAPLSDNCDFDIKMVKGHVNGRFELRKMLGMISGDIIYASKPMLPSFGVALLKKIISRKPVVLDIDDWQLGFGKEFYDSLNWAKKFKDFMISIQNSNSYYYNMVLHRFIRFANAITVSGRVLHSIYGGTIIWHGRDVKTFDPCHYDRSLLKKKFLPDKDEDIFIIGFIGTPRPHKGIEDIIDAISLIRDKRFLLMIAGIEENNDYHKCLKQRIDRLGIKENVMCFKQLSFRRLPEFLAITDLIVIPQRRSPASYGQVPAKIFDAMAMAKPIIATRVFEIPDILNDCGWIVEPENPELLAKTIKYVFEHPVEAEGNGRKARDKCVKEYSWDLMEKKLEMLFNRYNNRNDLHHN